MCRALTYEQLYKYQIAGGARYAKSHCDQLPVTPFWVRAERAYDRHPRAFTREHPYVAKLIFKSEHSKGCQGPPPVGVPNPTPPGGPELPPGGIPVLPPDCVPRPPDCVSEPSVLGLLVPTAIVCLLLRRQLRQFINKFEEVRVSDELTMNEFQAKAMGTAVYPERGGCVLYPLLGLIDEVGEVAEKVADGWDNSAAILGLSELRDDDLPLAVVADVLEIAGLVGLLAGELKKIYRDGDGKFTDEKLKDLAAAFAVLRVSVRSPALDRLWKMPEDSRPPLSLAESRTKFSNKKEIADELGDVQYYVAAVASEFAYTLGEIGRRNNAKLASRQARGVLHGSGDDR